MKKKFKNIREFIDTLEEIGELKRIKEEVSPEIEISKYTDVDAILTIHKMTKLEDDFKCNFNSLCLALFFIKTVSLGFRNKISFSVKSAGCMYFNHFSHLFFIKNIYSIIL